MKRTLCIALPFLLACATLAADWPQFRGPGAQGHTDAHPPLTWSETTNIAWKTPLPGRGHSSPVVAGDHIWLTTAYETEATEAEKEERLKANTGSQPVTVLSRVDLHALCVDRASGELLHNIPLLTVRDPQWVHQLNSYASPTPVLEKGRLYCHFGSYGTACLDTAAREVLWRNQELHCMHENGPGCSPLIHGDVLIFHMDGSDTQHVVGLDKHSGKVAWKTARSGEMHENPQLKKAYATPLVADGLLISPAANWLYAYDPADGTEKWKVPYGQLGFSNVARPVARDGMVYVSTCFMKAALLAVDTTAEPPAAAWTYKKGVPKMPSPILVGDEIYFVDDKVGVCTCLDARTGEEHWRERLGGGFSASPIAAGTRIYWPAQDGETVVIEAGRKFNVLARNPLDGRLMASFAVVGDTLYARTDKALYAIRER